MVTEIVSLKTRIKKITDEHKIAMFQNTKTVNSIVRMHEETLENKTKEVANIMQELQRLEVTNEELLQKNQELEMNKNNYWKEVMKTNHFLVNIATNHFFKFLK